jgi:adiponectin receptor
MAGRRKPQVDGPTASKSPANCTVMESKEDLWHTLIKFETLEHWRQDNHYIVNSYRKTANSYRRSYASVFQIHNETVNIWSHLLPAVLSLPIASGLYYTLGPRYDRAFRSDVVAMGCFFLGALLCLGMSATWVVVALQSRRY